MSESLVLWSSLLSYPIAALIPTLVFAGRKHARGWWIAAALAIHLSLVNVLNRFAWPALRPRPDGVDGIPNDGEYMRGSLAELEARLQWLQQSLALSVACSLLVILLMCLVWRFSRRAEGDLNAANPHGRTLPGSSALVIAGLLAAIPALGCVHARAPCEDFRANAGSAVLSIGSTERLDVAPLLSRIRPSQVVAIGEPTHGSHEHRVFQARMMESLVAELGYTGVAIEGIGVEAFWINDYICDKGAPFDPLIFDADEYYDATDWLRAYNGARGFEDCVSIIPFDPLESGYSPMTYVLSTLDAAHVDAGVDEGHEACLRAWVGDKSRVYDPCRPDAAAALERALAGRGPSFARVRGAARLAWQAAIVASSERSGDVRDHFMAANVMAALAEHPKGIVLWAHDAHISKSRIDPRLNDHNTDNTTGARLSRALGDRYLSVAQLSQRGSALVFDTRKERYRADNFEAGCGYFERLVDSADTAVDLRDLAPGNPAWECVMSEHRVMWFGATHSPWLNRSGKPIVPGAAYDIIVLMGTTTPTQRTKGRFLDRVVDVR